MDTITKRRGLKHIAEDIFRCLDKESINSCRLVKQSWTRIVDNPQFWLKKIEKKDNSVKAKWSRLVRELTDEDPNKERYFLKLDNRRDA